MSEARTSTTFDKYRAAPPEIYERHFVPSIGVPTARVLLASAGLRPGERVLDLACGTGVVARMAAEQVGAEGRVTGVDPEPGMLAVARSTDPAGPEIAWREGRAEELPFPDDTFDVVVCSLGLQFFADKVAALREARRVCVPGGRLVFATPGPTPPLFEAVHDLLAEYLGPEAGGFVQAVFSVHDPAEIRSIASAAGLERVDVQIGTTPLRLAAPADFLWQYVQGTPMALLAAQLDDSARAALERDVVEAWQPFVEDGALVMEPGVTVTVARV